jgi:hypothetical protein
MGVVTRRHIEARHRGYLCGMMRQPVGRLGDDACRMCRAALTRIEDEAYDWDAHRESWLICEGEARRDPAFALAGARLLGTWREMFA